MDTDKPWRDISRAVADMSNDERERYAVQFPAMVWHQPIAVETEAGDSDNIMVNFSIN